MAVFSPQQLAEDDIIAQSKQREEPGWLQKARVAGWRAFQEGPMPHLERTRLKEDIFDGYTLAQAVERAASWEAVPAAVRSGLGLDGEPANAVVMANGFVQWASLDARWAGKGVVFCSLAEAVVKYPDLVKDHLAGEAVPAEGDKPWALNAALWTDGVFIYVPKGVEVDDPLQVFLWGEGNVGLFDRTLIVAEPNSRVTVVAAVTSPEGAAPALRSGVVEVYARDGAQVKYCALQTLAEGQGTNLVLRRALVDANASVQWVVGEFGSALTTSISEALLRGRGGEATNLTVFFSGGNQHLDVEPRMYHTGTHTQSNILVKGVAKESGRSVYVPVTSLEDEADEAAAFQRGTTLLLDKDARAYCIPQLFVGEEAVAGAGHAATVGQVDEEQLFYLRSRGLTEEQAKKLIVHGFFHPVLEMVPVEGVRRRLEQLIDRKMAG